MVVAFLGLAACGFAADLEARVQLDKVGAMIIWCKDATGRTVSSHSTSSHAPYVNTPRTRIVDKGAGETLIIDLERRGARAVITGVR